MTFLLWTGAVVALHVVTAALSGLNAAYFLSRPWPTPRLRAGAWTLALVSLGVAFQSAFIALVVLSFSAPLTPSEARAWLAAGSGGLAGSALVAVFVLLRHLRRP